MCFVVSVASDKTHKLDRIAIYSLQYYSNGIILISFFSELVVASGKQLVKLFSPSDFTGIHPNVPFFML